MEEPKVITIDDVFDSTVMHINDFPRPNSTLGPGSDAVLHMNLIPGLSVELGRGKSLICITVESKTSSIVITLGSSILMKCLGKSR